MAHGGPPASARVHGAPPRVHNVTELFLWLTWYKVHHVATRAIWTLLTLPSPRRP